MITKCPGCGGALEFSPQSGRMECGFCGNSYEPIQSNIEFEDRENMECNTYECTSCGAQLLVNGVETSSFCAYCGQPTVVFSRVSKELKPDYIIPFGVTKEQAFEIVHQRFNKGTMVPKEIKNFQIDKMRGIYIPYFIYDIDYCDTQGLERPGSKNRAAKYFIRKAECEFRGIIHDASRMLNDESAIRLEPYDLSGLRPFEPQYLSGFYADRYDLNQQEMVANGVKRAKEFFDFEIKKSVNERDVRLLQSNPFYRIRQIHYALLPAWFITFRYKDESYTILVNGQTGKMVGTVPIDMGSMWKTFFLTWLVFTVLLIPFVPFLGGQIGFMIAMGLVIKAVSDYRKIYKNMKATKSQSTVKYVKERQDRT